jgi:phosphatidylserine/phosphatidylglycerophosphate/cardiolipin synthase-like enzyme
VTPLLTPDKLANGGGQYLSHILDRVGGAKKSIYIQLQYIESSSGQGDVYDNLLKAIKKRIDDGINVQLIVSANYAEKWAEKMKDGKSVDLTANIRTQPDVHNKGFVVDSQTVIVSSQNFSPAGVSQNRDAGVILQSPELAGYFEPIFLTDWARALPIVAKSAGAAGGSKGGGRTKAASASRRGSSATSKKKTAKKAATKTATKKKAARKAPAKGRSAKAGKRK